jgi:hypothetical protein
MAGGLSITACQSKLQSRSVYKCPAKTGYLKLMSLIADENKFILSEIRRRFSIICSDSQKDLTKNDQKMKLNLISHFSHTMVTVTMTMTNVRSTHFNAYVYHALPVRRFYTRYTNVVRFVQTHYKGIQTVMSLCN